jgi:hypothetical protein
MASADLLRREEEFYSSLFDSAKGNPFITRKKNSKTPMLILPPNWPNVAIFPEILVYWTQATALGRAHS